MKIKRIIFGLILIAVFAVSFSFVEAQPVPPTSKVTAPPVTSKVTSPEKTASFLQNPLQAKNIEEVLTTIVDLAIFIGMIFAVLMFIWIGFKFVLAQGNSTKLSEARTWFLYAVIGTAVLISAKVIVEVVKNTFISAGVVNENYFKKP